MCLSVNFCVKRALRQSSVMFPFTSEFAIKLTILLKFKFIVSVKNNFEY